MSEEEMIEYLISTGLYKDTKSDLFYEKRMINTNKTIPISELIERFISVDKEYGGGLWNIKQILNNIDIINNLVDFVPHLVAISSIPLNRNGFKL